MAGGWLGHKEARRENILEKGGNCKRPEESVWLEPECELSGHGSCMAFLDSAFYPNPRAEPAKGLNEESKMNHSGCWLLEIRWVRIETGILTLVVSGWVRKEGGLNQ